MSIETFPQTTIGSAAAAVVDGLAPKRPFTAIKWDGSKITADGVYDMPIEAYHGDCCEGPSISSSGLRTIINQTPAHYWDTSYLNANRDPEPDKEHFNLGRAAHTLLLGESGFRQLFAIRPDEFPDWRTKAAKEWRAEQVAHGRTVITSKDVETIRRIAASLAADPLINDGLLNGEVERSIIWKDKETGIWLKSRPDALPVNADIVADLKTTSDASRRKCEQSIYEYGYHMQLALVGMGMDAVLGRKLTDDDYVLIFVETTRPYLVNVKPIDAQDIARGRSQLRSAINKFADCLSCGDWPGYEDNGMTAYLPKYARDKIDFEIQHGILPEVA